MPDSTLPIEPPERRPAPTVLRPEISYPGGAELPRGPDASGPEERFGRYILREELGHGSMGVVRLAFDTQLKREVAIKLLRAREFMGLEMKVRFRKEAEAAAKLSHPNIVVTYDVGEEAGRRFITMELVKGGSLARLLERHGGRLAPHEAMRLARETALGLAHAHAHGIVHRDLKPENILLEDLNVGARPQVSDFGLAQEVREKDAPRLTVHGTIVGTPTYMAPEQAQGLLEEVDPQSDVYALGGVLYEMVSGRPPYVGDSPMQVILQKLSLDPPPPRQINPAVARDVETIILKALAREKPRRYASATEFAEDLARCLAGEAIRARPDAWWEVGLRWARRRKALALTGAAAVFAIVLAIATEWKAAEERGKQADLEAEVVRHLRGVAEANLDATLALRRAGIAGGVRDHFLARLEEAAREAIDRAPTLAEPHYHLGRMYRAQMRFAEALAQQDLALGKEPGWVPSLYERAILTIRNYDRRLAELREQWMRGEGRRLAKAGELAKAGVGPGELTQRPSEEALSQADPNARQLRAGIIADLQALERNLAPGTPAGVSLGVLRCARGLFLRYGGERAEGARLLEESIGVDPTLEEAYEGLAQSAMTEGDYARASKWYEQGIVADRGYVPFRTGFADASFKRAVEGNRRGENPVPYFATAVEQLGKALEQEPRSAEILWRRGQAQASWGDYVGDQAGDPDEYFERAEADFGRALEFDPQLAEAWMGRGWVRVTRGYQRSDRGLDPREFYTQAVEDYGRAIALRPQWAEAWRRRADTHRYWGLNDKNRGEDPGSHYREALDDYTKALELDPHSSEAWKQRGAVRHAWGTTVKTRGKDPFPLLAAASADYEAALALDPDSSGLWLAKAQLQVNWAACLAIDGNDPAEPCRRSIEDFARALQLNPANTGALNSCAAVRLLLADYERGLGRDIGPILDSAESELERSIKLIPRGFDAQGLFGRLLDLRGLLAVDRGDDPTASFEKSLTLLGEAVEYNPTAADAWMHRGILHTHWGAFRAARGGDPEPLYRAGFADLARAGALNAGWDEVWLNRAVLGRDWALWLHGKGLDAEDRFVAAVADCDQALAKDPAMTEAFMRRGEIRSLWADCRATRGEDVKSLRAEALADQDRAIACGPNHAEAHFLRGLARLAVGMREEAAADFAEALRLAPGRKIAFEAVRAEAERKAGPK